MGSTSPMPSKEKNMLLMKVTESPKLNVALGGKALPSASTAITATTAAVITAVIMNTLAVVDRSLKSFR